MKKIQNNIFTHLTEEEKLKLFNTARNTRGKVFVEIGSYLGASSCCIAEGIKEKEAANLFCIDTWTNFGMTEGERDTFSEFLKNTGEYQHIITPLRGWSYDVASQLNEKIDFLFIDGDHSYEGVRKDVELFLPKLNSSSVVIFHDSGWAEGVKRVIDEEIRPLCKSSDSLPNMFCAYF